MKHTLIIVFIFMTFLHIESSAQEAKVKWYTIEEAEALTKKAPRKIYIDMYTDWCGWCKTMDKKTFTDERIIEHLNTNFYAVKFNAESKDSVVFKNTTFKFVAQGSRGYNELAAALMQGKMSYPTSVFLDEELNLISPLPGYHPPDKLDPVLDFIGNSHYETTSYEQFLSNKGNLNN